MAKGKNELSLIVQVSEGVSMALRSDLSKLSDYQSLRLKEFLRSVLAEPKEEIRVINSYPQIIRELPTTYEIGISYYGGL